MFLDVEWTRVQMNGVAAHGPFPSWHPSTPSLTDGERKQLGDNGSNDNTGTTERKKHVDTRSKRGEQESNSPHSDGVLDISNARWTEAYAWH